MQTYQLEIIFKVKRDSVGKITEHKAQLIMKGYAQRYGIDFIYVFAPMTRLNMIRVLLAMSAYFG